MAGYRRGESGNGLDFENRLWCSGDVLNFFGGDQTWLKQSLPDICGKGSRDEIGRIFSFWDGECEAVWNMLRCILFQD
jgi:hypothetical protein